MINGLYFVKKRKSNKRNAIAFYCAKGAEMAVRCIHVGTSVATHVGPDALACLQLERNARDSKSVGEPRSACETRIFADDSRAFPSFSFRSRRAKKEKREKCLRMSNPEADTSINASDVARAPLLDLQPSRVESRRIESNRTGEKRNREKFGPDARPPIGQG